MNRQSTEDLWDRIPYSIVYGTTMVEIRHSAFVQIPRVYNAKSEPQCKPKFGVMMCGCKLINSNKCATVLWDTLV
jgi:hypothetical protein